MVGMLANIVFRITTGSTNADLDTTILTMTFLVWPSFYLAIFTMPSFCKILETGSRQFRTQKKKLALHATFDCLLGWNGI
jgi:hypothetical protein